MLQDRQLMEKGRCGEVKNFCSNIIKYRCLLRDYLLPWPFKSTGQMVFKGIINRIDAGEC